VRYDGDTAIDCASFPPTPEISTVGMRWPLGGTNVRSLVRETCAPARIDDYSQLDGALADHARRIGSNSLGRGADRGGGFACGACMIVSHSELLCLPEDNRGSGWPVSTELLATAIANAESTRSPRR